MELSVSWGLYPIRACAFRRMMLHKRPLSVVQYVLSLPAPPKSESFERYAYKDLFSSRMGGLRRNFISADIIMVFRSPSYWKLRPLLNAFHSHAHAVWSALCSRHVAASLGSFMTWRPVPLGSRDDAMLRTVTRHRRFSVRNPAGTKTKLRIFVLFLSASSWIPAEYSDLATTVSFQIL
jgi:hypothetical protein